MKTLKAETRLAGLAAMFPMTVAGVAIADPVIVNFLTAEKSETFASIIQQFGKENLDIKANFETVPFENMVPTIEALIDGHDSSIDAFLVDTPRVPAMANSGYLAKISDEMDKVKAGASDQPLWPRASASRQKHLFGCSKKRPD